VLVKKEKEEAERMLLYAGPLSPFFMQNARMILFSRRKKRRNPPSTPKLGFSIRSIAFMKEFRSSFGADGREESSKSAHDCFPIDFRREKQKPTCMYTACVLVKKKRGIGSYRRQEPRRARGGIYKSLLSGAEHNVPRLAVEYPASGTSPTTHPTDASVFCFHNTRLPHELCFPNVWKKSTQRVHIR